VVKRKISIHDIARQLEVSAATISYVLNGKATEKRISSAMEQKVLQYVESCGYRPNRVAKSLRTGKSKIIGMLVEDIADPFFSSISRIIEKYAHRHDYKIFHASTENDVAITRDLLRVFRDTQVDGYIIAPPPGIEKDIAALMNDDLPIVLFDRFFPELETYNIIVDNLGGAREAVDHFIANGYKNIGLVTLNSTQTQMYDRLLGYSNAMAQQGLTPAVLKIPYEMEREKLVVEKITDFLQSNPALDAILFATNYLAISGLEAIHTCGLKIPDDMAVVGFDDNTHFSLFSPSISAVAQPVEEMSKAVIEALMNCLSGSGNVLGKETIVLPTRLVIRQSSRQVARNKLTV
jgi:LacI family transcriptional regulator